MQRKFFVILPIIFSIIVTNVSLSDVPIIVIAPSKKSQSISTVGTSVTILDENFFKNSNEYFLGDVLSSNTTSTNFFQSGGHGTSSAIQLHAYLFGIQRQKSTSPVVGLLPVRQRRDGLRQRHGTLSPARGTGPPNPYQSVCGYRALGLQDFSGGTPRV